jgi:RNA polymerase sigma-70 factor, ECF subfamily
MIRGSFVLMASSPEDVGDLFLAGLRFRPVRKQLMPELANETALVRAARGGDRAAFGHLYDRYARMVHGVLLARVPLHEVDDLVQDVFMIALRQLSTLREAESFGAWLTVIARNRANDYHRRSVPEDQLADEAPDREIATGSSGDNHGEAADILDAIKNLPGTYQETLILRLVEGMTGPEIAVHTGMTHGSVRVNLHRGMERLRAKLSSSPSRKRSQ